MKNSFHDPRVLGWFRTSHLVSEFTKVNSAKYALKVIEMDFMGVTGSSPWGGFCNYARRPNEGGCVKKLSIALMSLAVAACSSGPEQVTPNENSNTNLTTTLSLSFSPLEFFDYFPGDEWVNVTGGTVQVFAELQMKCKGGSIYASLELNTMGSDDAWHQVFWDFIHPDPDYDLGVIKKRFGHSFLLPPGGKFRWAVREDASDSVCITGDHVFTGPSMFSFQKIDISAPSVD